MKILFLFMITLLFLKEEEFVRNYICLVYIERNKEVLENNLNLKINSLKITDNKKLELLKQKFIVNFIMNCSKRLENKKSYGNEIKDYLLNPKKLNLFENFDVYQNHIYSNSNYELNEEEQKYYNNWSYINKLKKDQIEDIFKKYIKSDSKLLYFFYELKNKYGNYLIVILSVFFFIIGMYIKKLISSKLSKDSFKKEWDELDKKKK